MRRVTRLTLPSDVTRYLSRRQNKANSEHGAGTLDTNYAWASARQTQKLEIVLGKLRTMAGERQRCMYCSDSAGTDIEHYWPKGIYHQKMFEWPNLLLCCTGCGRDNKGSKFPLKNGTPLLIDPSDGNDPWYHLDFSPSTGAIIPRMDALGVVSEKGDETVKTLKLDRRDAVTIGYQKSFRRIKRAMEAALAEATPDATVLINTLSDADDHGLLGWCFRGNGTNDQPMLSLRKAHPSVWTACVNAFQNI